MTFLRGLKKAKGTFILGFDLNLNIFFKITALLSEKFSKSENLILNFIIEDYKYKHFGGSIIYLDNYYMGHNLLEEPNMLQKNHVQHSYRNYSKICLISNLGHLFWRFF